LTMMLRLYDVSRSGYQSWLTRGESKRSGSDSEVLAAIERIFVLVEGAYGSPKMTQALRSEGWVVGENRIARLMRENGLEARCSRIYRKHAGVNRFFAKIKNEIYDQEATGPDQIWVGDVTYLRVNGVWRYLAVVMDLYSRKIVGWSLSRHRDAKLSLAAFKRATSKRLLKAGLYFHSDRGAEYVATKYQDWLEDQGVIQSMNRKGRMNDNATMESFFHNFKAERVHGHDFMTEKELRAKVSSYVSFYNERRIHSSLGYVPPSTYEMMAA
jgi:putative transposase